MENERRYLEFLSTQFNNPPFDGARVTDPIELSRDVGWDGDGEWIWQTRGNMDAWSSGGFLSTGGTAIRYEPTKEELTRFDVDPDELPYIEAPSFSGNLTWNEALQQLSDQQNALTTRRRRLDKTTTLAEFKHAVLNNVLYGYEVLGDDVASTDSSEAAVRTGRGLPEARLLETLAAIVQQLEEQPDATNFVGEICAGAAQELHISATGVKTRIDDHLFRIFESRFSDLELPTTKQIRDWRDRLSDLRVAIFRWEKTFAEINSAKT